MPNRLLKETIRTSRKVNGLSDFNYRVWTYLITYVDDFGRGSADPELLKGLVFPRRSGMTVKQISKALAELATSGMILLYESDGEPFFCFPNWDKHQQIRAKKSKFPEPECFCNQMISNDINRNQTISNVPVIQSNPIQSESESESESESNPVSHARAREDDAFSRFWAVYPKKVGKLAAQKSFAKVKTPVETLIAAVERQKQSVQWQKDGGQYIPNPATWLNQGRWEDDLEAAADAGGSRSYFYGKYKSMEDDE